MLELKQHYTIALVTHNMQQATRVADITAFFGTYPVNGGAPEIIKGSLADNLGTFASLYAAHGAQSLPASRREGTHIHATDDRSRSRARRRRRGSRAGTCARGAT